jgi:hypothetical protein
MIDAYPLTWPVHWPRTHTPQRSSFQTTIANARMGVLRELEFLGARDIVISSNAELLRNGDIASRQRYIEDTGVAVYFTLRGEQKCIPCDKWIALQDNLRAIEKTINALRGIERWGAKELVDAAFRGFEALPSGERWWEILAVPQSASKDVVTMAYRRLVKLQHPDAGGDAERFHRIQQAYDEAVAS